MFFKTFGMINFLVFSSFVFGLNQAKTDANSIIKADKKAGYDSLPQDAPLYLDEISKPYHKKPPVVKHVLGRKEEAFKLAEEKIDSLPKEERQKFAELLEIMSRYCILDLSKSDLPESEKKALFMSFAKKYLSDFASSGSHEEAMDGYFPGKKRYSESYGNKTFVGYLQEDKNCNYNCALFDLAQREMLKMLSKEDEEEAEKIKKRSEVIVEDYLKNNGNKKTAEELIKDADDYYIINSDFIKLILNSKQPISDDLLNKYASTIPSMGKFIVLVNKFNTKLNNAKLNNAKLNAKEKNSGNKIKIRSIDFKNTDKIFALREKIKPIYREENKTVVIPSSIFAKADKHLKYFGLQISSNFDQKIRKELISKLRKNQQMKKINKNEFKQKIEKRPIIIYNEKPKDEIEFEELPFSNEIATKTIKQKVDPEKANQPSVSKALFVASKDKVRIIGFSFILSFIYFFKKVILQFIKTIIKYSI